jgi:hypothetical protein
MKTRPQKDDGWKVEPLPNASAASIAELHVPDLVLLLAAAYRRIYVLEEELNRHAA